MKTVLCLHQFDLQGCAAALLSTIASWKSSKLMTIDTANSRVRTNFSEDLVVLLWEASVKCSLRPLQILVC